jgi:hypothetical protein
MDTYIFRPYKSHIPRLGTASQLFPCFSSLLVFCLMFCLINSVCPFYYSGTYQYWQSLGTQNGVAAAQQVPTGFGDWTVYNSSYVSHACGSSSSNNGYHQSLRLYSNATWPSNFMPRNPCYGAYLPAIQDYQAPSYQQVNNREEDSGIFFIPFPIQFVF